MHKLLTASFFFISVLANANNVQLSNISVTNNVTNTGKIIHFDISWENSWRTTSTNNLDAVWVFFKVKDNDGQWYPLRFTGSNITMPSGFAHDMGSNAGVTGIGMFIFRSANGFGTATAIDVRAGITSFPGTLEIRGFAIEMVYVPQGSFYLGDGNTGDTYRDSTAGTPYQVTGTGNTIQIGSTAGKLYDGLLTQPYTGNLAGFPTGYNAFWMMKYEVSQGAYRDFLNTLSYIQQLSRLSTTSPPNSAAGTCISCITVLPRSRLKIITPGDISHNTGAVIGCDNSNDNIYNQNNDGEWRAMGTISWPDAAAYLDWAGLRPMTEMEFEKSARGPLAPVLNEFAWGTPDIWSPNPSTLSFTNNGGSDEVLNMSSAVLGNAIYNANPNSYSLKNFRGGMFATASSTRISSGAGYYGAMELSGNMLEFTVFTNSAAGRSFGGKHGDGSLDVDGNANENFWPGINGNANDNTANTAYIGFVGVTNAAGIETRGGSSSHIASALYISNRYTPGTSPAVRLEDYGIRGVRDAN